MNQLPSQSDPKKPSWMTDEEWNAHTRHVWNQLQAKIDNPSPLVKKGSTILVVAFLVCVVVAACAGLLRLAWEVLH